MNAGINYLLTGAGFLPSTVVHLDPYNDGLLESYGWKNLLHPLMHGGSPIISNRVISITTDATIEFLLTMSSFFCQIISILSYGITSRNNYINYITSCHQEVILLMLEFISSCHRIVTESTGSAATKQLFLAAWPSVGKSASMLRPSNNCLQPTEWWGFFFKWLFQDEMILSFKQCLPPKKRLWQTHEF